MGPNASPTGHCLRRVVARCLKVGIYYEAVVENHEASECLMFVDVYLLEQDMGLENSVVA